MRDQAKKALYRARPHVHAPCVGVSLDHSADDNRLGAGYLSITTASIAASSAGPEANEARLRSGDNIGAQGAMQSCAQTMPSAVNRQDRVAHCEPWQILSANRGLPAFKRRLPTVITQSAAQPPHQPHLILLCKVLASPVSAPTQSGRVPRCGMVADLGVPARSYATTTTIPATLPEPPNIYPPFCLGRA